MEIPITSMLGKGAVFLLKEGLEHVLDASELEKAITKTNEEFKNELENLDVSLKKWCNSAQFGAILEQLVKAERVIHDDEVTASFIAFGGFAFRSTDGTDASTDKATEILGRFVQNLETELVRSDAYIHFQRSEINHVETHGKLDQIMKVLREQGTKPSMTDEDRAELLSEVSRIVEAALQGLGDKASVSVRSNLPSVDQVPLPPRVATRKILVSGLLELALQFGFLWLHGSSGTGKTVLALLVAHQDKAKWLFLDLRSCTANEIKVKLDIAGAAIESQDLSGIVLDDLPIRHLSSVMTSLLQLDNALRARKCPLIVTSANVPTPEFRSRLGDKALRVEQVPYLTEEDVSELVAQGGGDPTTWAKVLHVFAGGGHPVLVSARLVGLIGRSWPISELLAELPSMGGSREVKSQQEAVILRLIEELPPETRLLLYRLSLIMSPFDRELAMAVAASSTAIGTAGEHFEYLLGPWVEARGEDAYAVSPLAIKTGVACLNTSEQSRVRKDVIRNLIHRSPFPGEQLSQLFLFSILEQDITGLGWFIQAMLQHLVGEKDTFALMAQQVSYLTAFGVEQPLFPSDPTLSALLRLIQCFVALETDAQRVEEIFNAVDKECSSLPDKSMSAGLRLLAFSLISLRGSFVLQPRKWFQYVTEFDTLRTESGSMGRSIGRMTELAGDSVLSPQQILFAIQANSIKSIASLAGLFEALDELEPSQRKYFLAALDDEVLNRRFVISNAWCNEAKRDQLNGSEAAELYERLASLAEKWLDTELQIACICAQVVMLDEYATQTDEAMNLLNEMTTKFGSHDQLLRRKQVMLFRTNDYVSALEAFPNVRQSFPKDSYERAQTLRHAGISAAKLDRLEDARIMLQEASDATAQSELDSHPFSLGILADCSLIEFARGNLDEAVRLMIAAIEKGEQLIASAPDYKNTVAIALEPPLKAMALAAVNSDLSIITSVIGQFNAFAAPSNVDESPHSLTEILWYQLALLEQALGVDVGALDALRERTKTQGCLGLEVLLSQSAIERACFNGSVDDFVRELPSYLDLISTFEARLDSIQPMAFERLEITQIAPASWIDSRCSGYFHHAVLTFSLLALANGNEPKIAELIVKLQGLIPPTIALTRFLDRLCCSTNNDFVMESEIMTIASCIAICRNADIDSLSPETTLKVTYYLWVWLHRKPHGKLVEQVTDFISRLWERAIAQRRSMFLQPMSSIPHIEDMLRSSEMGATKLAKIILSADGATSVSLGATIRDELSEYLDECDNRETI